MLFNITVTACSLLLMTESVVKIVCVEVFFHFNLTMFHYTVVSAMQPFK